MKRVITIGQFYKEREQWKKMVELYKSPEDVVHDPGDDIVCDICNGEGFNKENGTVSIFEEIAETPGSGYVICPDCEKND